MVGKNLMMVLIGVVVLAAAFFGYLYFKKDQDLEAHHQEQYRIMTIAAQTSPQGGMEEMGWAINKYFDENKAYPTNLDALYPTYISSQSFITDVNWNYQLKGDNFLLSKRIDMKGRTLLASTDKSLRVRMGTSTMVAMVDKKATAVPVATKPVTAPKPSTKDMLSKPLSPPGLSPTAETLAGQTEKAREPEDIAPSKTETQTVVLDKTETPSGLASELSNAYLVWKDEHGHLGFGNVQYPRIDGLSIATPHNWFNVKRRPKAEASSTQEIITSPGDIDMEFVASKFSDQYLVWKDRDGNIGFGDAQYPSAGDIEYVNIDGEWIILHR